jgi:hypothetical protein
MLSLLFGVIVAVTLFVGYAIFNVMFVNSLLKGFADKVTLAAACALNDSDRIGDMNNLIAQARQLVFASRETSDNISTTNPELQPVADQLLLEDRENALALDKERINLAKLACADAETALQSSFNDQTGIYRTVFPLLGIKTPKLVSMSFGNVSNVDSNVALLTGIENLASYDQSSKLVNTSSKLYLGNIDAKLPGADNDIDFNLSSLAAPINGTSSPARLLLPDAVQPLDDKSQRLPSAVTVVISAPANNGTTTQQVMSAAATYGGMPEE